MDYVTIHRWGLIETNKVRITKQLSNTDYVRVRVLGRQQNVLPRGTLEPTFFGNIALRLFVIFDKNAGDTIIRPLYIKLNKEVLSVRILSLVTTLSHATTMVW